MTISFVQSFTEISVSSGSSGNATATTTAGNLLVCFAGSNVGTGAITASDGTNTWTTNEVHTSGNSPGQAMIASAPNIAGGSTTVTVSYATSTTYRARIVEFSGAATTSVVSTTGEVDDDTTTAPNAVNSTGVVVPAGGLACCSYVFDRSPSPSAGSGYTSIASAGGDYFWQYKVFAGGASAERGAISSSPTHYNAVIVVFNAAAGGGNNDISVPLATLTLTGNAPTVVATANNSIAVPLATLTLTGYAPTINNAANNNIDVPAGTLTLTAYAPTVSFTGNQTVAVPLATLTLTAYAPVVTNAITFITEPLINNTETILASVAVDWSWFPGGTIGTLNAITPTDGSGTTASDGTLTVSGITAGAGFVLITDGSGHVYYEAGTAA